MLKNKAKAMLSSIPETQTFKQTIFWRLQKQETLSCGFIVSGAGKQFQIHVIFDQVGKT
jgi:hypothetical protein